MSRFLRPLFILLFFSFLPLLAAADLPGSKDPAGIKRYEGSQIVRYEQLQFDRFVLPLGKMTRFDFGTKAAEFEKSISLEGAVTRVSYHLADPLRSSLEVFRNYESDLKESGWQILWSASGKPEFGNSFAHLYELLKDNDQLFTYNEQNAHVLAAQKPESGLSALLFVTKFEMGLTRGIKVAKGDPIVQLDVIQTKSMEQKMVIPTASEMDKSISQTGKVSLYGLFFDFNSAVLKSESEPTLVQIGNLFREKPSLKVLVTGHTDNVGDFEFNRDLSERRATAVVDALTKSYGVDRSRLRSFGASFAAPVATNLTEEGRMKNRRVELVELSSGRP